MQEAKAQRFSFYSMCVKQSFTAVLLLCFAVLLPISCGENPFGFNYEEKLPEEVVSDTTKPGITEDGTEKDGTEKGGFVTIPDEIPSIDTGTESGGNASGENGNLTAPDDNSNNTGAQWYVLDTTGTIAAIGASGDEFPHINLTIPDRLPVNGTLVSIISVSAGGFQQRGLHNVSLPDSLTVIDHLAFSDNLLTSITLPNRMVRIGTQAFANNVISSVTITSRAAIAADAFKGNPITSITLTTPLSDVSAQAFPHDFGAFYSDLGIGNGVRTGTYRWNGATWSRQSLAITP